MRRPNRRAYLNQSPDEERRKNEGHDVQDKISNLDCIAMVEIVREQVDNTCALCYEGIESSANVVRPPDFVRRPACRQDSHEEPC